MKSKTHELNTNHGNYFLLVLIVLIFLLTPSNSGANFEGNFIVTIPGNRLLKSMKLGVELSRDPDIFSIQRQFNEVADFMIQVGNLSKVTFTKNRKGELRYKNSEQNSIQAIFYLYDNVELVKTFTIKPRFYSKNNEFHSKGITDKVFNLEFLEVDRVGDTTGKLLKKIESVAFEIGSENSFNLDLKPSNGKKIAVKLNTQDVGQQFLHFATKKNGEYPFHITDLKGILIKKGYSAPISFSYIVLRSPNSNYALGSTFHQLTSEVNQFVRSHSDYGKDIVIEVPIKLQMNLEDLDEAQRFKTSVGPFHE
ncbi:MAG: hypothetical protein VX619_04915 [bacterium]|nr:hypothetical protein [bacterium]